jgi:SAM-dependent methyltransferase
MTLGETSVPYILPHTQSKGLGRKVLHRILKAIYRALPAPPSTNYRWRQFDVKPYDFLPANSVIYDIGAQESRGHYAFGSPPPDSRVVCIDIEPGPGVDIVADAHDLHMVDANSADCVVCVGVLLHCRNPDKVISEFHRILKPGGILYITSPFVSPHPRVPAVYYFFSVEGLEATCARFVKIQGGFNRGPASAMSYLLVEFCSVLFSFNRKALLSFNLYIFSWLFFWIKYLDAFIARYDDARFFYSASYFIGRKAPSTTQQ